MTSILNISYYPSHIHITVKVKKPCGTCIIRDAIAIRKYDQTYHRASYADNMQEVDTIVNYLIQKALKEK